MKVFLVVCDSHGRAPTGGAPTALFHWKRRASIEEFLAHLAMNSFNSMEPKWEADKRIPEKGEFERPLIRLVLHMRVKATLIQPADPLYPRQLENAFNHNRLPAIAAAGNLDLLQGRM